ncbi:MAG: extracellular solute-binding protein [Hungatella hathewayi]|nr:extracellular solute-binding protein [Hungatella hathewayi]
MKRSKYFLMIALACASLGMTACGGKNTDRASGEVTGAETEAGKTDTSGAVVEVNFWSLFTGDDGVTMDKIVNQFNEEHPNIKVNHIAMEATTDLYVKLPMVANDDKQAPDLCVVHNNYIPYLADKGAIQPIEGLVGGRENLTEDKFNNADMAVYNGERYGVILDFPSAVLYGNQELIDQYYPEMLDDNLVTWDEIYELGDRLKAAGVVDQIKPLVGSWARNDVLQTFVTNGGTYSEDGKTLAMDKEALKKAQGEWKTLYDKGYFMEEDADALGMFAMGEAVFTTGGTWNLNVIKTYGLDYVMLPGVQYGTDDVLTYAAAHTFVMPQRGYTDEKREAAGEFISWFEDHAMLWADAGSIIANKELAAGEEYAKLPQAMVDKAGTRHWCPTFLYSSVCDAALNSYGFQAVYGHLTIDEYADAVIAKIEAEIQAQQ